MRIRLAVAALIAGGVAIAPAASATEVCHRHNFGAKFNGLWFAACVGDERDTPVYATCGSYTMRCAG